MWVRARPSPPTRDALARRRERRAGSSACGFGLRGSEAREAGPAQARVPRRKRGASAPEARPLRTTAELWQVHPKGTRSGREAGVLNRSAGPVRTEIAAWDAGRPAPTTTDKRVARRPAPPLFDSDAARQPRSTRTRGDDARLLAPTPVISGLRSGAQNP